MRAKMVGTMLAALLVVGVIAPAAMAGDQGVGIIQGGSAEVGRTIAACDKDTQGDPQGNGITIPGINSGDFKYRLTIPSSVPGAPPGQMLVAGVTTNDDNGKDALIPRTGTATLSICGNVGPVKTVGGTALGAWCGLSKGYNGTGKLNVAWAPSALGTDTVQKYQLSDLTWKVSAGSVLPVIGKWRKLNDAGTTKKDIWGTVVSLVSARAIQGTSTCATNPTGGQVFEVDGVTAMVSAPGKGKDTVVRPNELPLLCKTGAPPCLYDPKAKPAPAKDE